MGGAYGCYTKELDTITWMEYVTGFRQGSHAYMNKHDLPNPLGGVEERMEACCKQPIRQCLEETRWPNLGP